MPTTLLPVALVAAPLAGLLCAAAFGRRRPDAALTASAAAAGATALVATAAVAAVVAGNPPAVSIAGTPVLGVDRLAALVTPVLALVATTVALYARRNLEGDPQGHRFAMAASLLLAATVTVVTAAALPILVGGWLVGSVATVALVAYRGTSPAKAAAGRAARALALGDAALIGAAVLVATAGPSGDDGGWSGLEASVTGLAGRTLVDVGPVSLTAATLAAGLLALGALARAGQLPLPRWLPGTVAAPTPVSALLHAGAVNAGAILLIRTTPVLDAAPLALGLLAAACLATLAVSVPALRARADVKGRLAESTGAQMAFMLLACAIGAPVVALTHLVGHSLYKSARFLGAGGALGREVTRRRWLPAAAPPTSLHRAAAVATGGAVGVVWLGLSAAAGLPDAERWLVGAALVAVGVRAASIAIRNERGTGLVLGAVSLAGIAAAAGVAVGADAAVGADLAHADALSPVVAIVALAGLLVLGHLLTRRADTAATLAGRLAPAGPALLPATVAAHSGDGGSRPAERDLVLVGGSPAWAEAGR